MNDTTKRIVKQLNKRDIISFDFDGTLDTTRGKALAKRLITQGYTIHIISARAERLSKSVFALADELGIPHSSIHLMGSNSAKVDEVKRLGVLRHYDNNMNVVKQLKEWGINAILTNY